MERNYDKKHTSHQHYDHDNINSTITPLGIHYWHGSFFCVIVPKMGAKVASCNSNGQNTHMKLPTILKWLHSSQESKTGNILKKAVISCRLKRYFQLESDDENLPPPSPDSKTSSPAKKKRKLAICTYHL